MTILDLQAKPAYPRSMKTLALALVILLAPVSAQAACHHYSHWAYPHPQRCSIHHKTYTQRLSHEAESSSHHSASEQTKPSWRKNMWERPANIPDLAVDLSDEALRRSAIERLEETH
jgi:hypothetical protein